MKKLKYLLPVVASITAIATVIIVLWGWYLSTDRVADMEFNILQIDSLVTLYEANDDNFNGVPNLSTTQNIDKYYSPEADAQVSYDNKYYTENYSFNYVDQRYALSQDSQANLLNTVTISDAAPSKIYSYKFEITNYVGLENQFEFNFLEDSEINLNILKDFEVRIGVVTDNKNIDFTEWTPFCTESNNTYSYSGLDLNPLSEDMTVPDKTGDLSVGRLDIWLQIRINKDATNDSISNFTLPYYRLTLSCEMQDEENN